MPGDDLAGARDALVGLAGLLSGLPAVTVGEEGRRLVRHGRELHRDAVEHGFPEAPAGRVRVLGAGGELLALAVPRGFESAAPGLPCVPCLHPDVVLLDS